MAVPDETVSEGQVILVRNKLGINLPKDYINFIMVNNVFLVIPYVFDVEGRRRVLGTLLSYDKSSCDNIEKVFENKKIAYQRVLIDNYTRFNLFSYLI